MAQQCAYVHGAERAIFHYLWEIRDTIFVGLTLLMLRLNWFSQSQPKTTLLENI